MKNVKAGHKKPIVCLDAGHYGKYNRSAVVPAYYESNAMWTLHNYLKSELEKYGIEVRQTRTTQAKDLGLIARGQAAQGCDLFVSLHSNACATEAVDYPLGVYMVDDNCGQIDEAAKEMAKILAGVVADTMGTASPAKIWTRSSSTDRDGNGYNDDYYGVLRGCHAVGTAGVILEHSFHTNAKAARWLLEDANLRKLAKAEAKALADYYGMSKATTSATAPSVKVDPAKSYDKTKAGKYKVTGCDYLNLRAGASTGKPVLEEMEKGTFVNCYGYYTGEWLYVRSGTGKTGFCHAAYLVKA